MTCCYGPSVVAFRTNMALQQEVDFRPEQPNQGNPADGQHGAGLPLYPRESVVRIEIKRKEDDPNEAGEVHGEANVLRFVEISRKPPSFERHHGAHSHQEHVVREQRDEHLPLQRAFDEYLPTVRDDAFERRRHVGEKRYRSEEALDEYEGDGDEDLRSGAHQERFVHGFFGAGKDAIDAQNFHEKRCVARRQCDTEDHELRNANRVAWCREEEPRECKEQGQSE